MTKFILDKNIRLKYDNVNEKYYAFSISSGDHYSLTKTGYMILEQIEKGRNIDEIARLMHEKESIDLKVCKIDIINFVDKSKKIGIIAIDKKSNIHDKKSQS